ncbi:hypothetical protein C8A03DRAFT_31362 [Achaetomium macrosporum]|uniref:Uncharacterized protein n=1 Tax=Achaetomium macrosporum TaxID=79813 RepID=A0AAN7HHD3_9PEZI|nr:hypothetical protein C8A03DRAFT_31362 [Achaetomium macrosporum]
MGTPIPGPYFAAMRSESLRHLDSLGKDNWIRRWADAIRSGNPSRPIDLDEVSARLSNWSKGNQSPAWSIDTRSPEPFTPPSRVERIVRSILGHTTSNEAEQSNSEANDWGPSSDYEQTRSDVTEGHKAEANDQGVRPDEARGRKRRVSDTATTDWSSPKRKRGYDNGSPVAGRATPFSQTETGPKRRRNEDEAEEEQPPSKRLRANSTGRSSRRSRSRASGAPPVLYLEHGNAGIASPPTTNNASQDAQQVRSAEPEPEPANVTQPRRSARIAARQAEAERQASVNSRVQHLAGINGQTQPRTSNAAASRAQNENEDGLQVRRSARIAAAARQAGSNPKNAAAVPAPQRRAQAKKKETAGRRRQPVTAAKASKLTSKSAASGRTGGPRNNNQYDAAAKGTKGAKGAGTKKVGDVKIKQDWEEDNGEE